MAGKAKSTSKAKPARSRSATKAKGLTAQQARLASQAEPHRGDRDEHQGRGGAATRGRGQVRRGGKTPSRSKD